MRFDKNPIWKQIDSFPYDAPNLIETFPVRLARKGKWTPSQVRHLEPDPCNIPFSFPLPFNYSLSVPGSF